MVSWVLRLQRLVSFKLTGSGLSSCLLCIHDHPVSCLCGLSGAADVTQSKYISEHIFRPAAPTVLLKAMHAVRSLTDVVSFCRRALCRSLPVSSSGTWCTTCSTMPSIMAGKTCGCFPMHARTTWTITTNRQRMALGFPLDSWISCS